jgi:protein-tyrosine phosphatase
MDGGVDEVPLPDELQPGRLWLCGKHVVAPDPDALLDALAANTVVCLNERNDLSRYPSYVDWLSTHDGGRARWYPIGDFDAPPLATATRYVDELTRALIDGAGLVMHCSAGLGRTGTIAICVLMRAGLAPAEAVDVVASSRPGAGPQNGTQWCLVEAFAREERYAVGDPNVTSDTSSDTGS